MQNIPALKDQLFNVDLGGLFQARILLSGILQGKQAEQLLLHDDIFTGFSVKMTPESNLAQVYCIFCARPLSAAPYTCNTHSHTT